ncbi:hypothetical protein DWW31_11080 [Clostridium sp. AF15-17LB]|nr:hypothetical protein DWW31_11080 [Clostridium sp. AF15-17LB]
MKILMLYIAWNVMVVLKILLMQEIRLLSLIEHIRLFSCGVVLGVLIGLHMEMDILIGPVEVIYHHFY